MKICLLLLSFLVFTGTSIGSSASNNDSENSDGNLLVKDIDFFIPEGYSMSITGNLEISDLSSFINDGDVYFANSNEIEIILPAKEIGSGIFSFNGLADTYVIANNTTIENVIIDTKESNLFLQNNLTIGNTLFLRNGVIHIDKNDASALTILNNQPEAIAFENCIQNKSYIDGPLVRSVSSDNSYCFPVGDQYNFHPISLAQISQSDLIRVNYQSDTKMEWESCNRNTNIRLLDCGGWCAQSISSSPVSFYPTLSLINNNGLVENGSFSLLSSNSTDFSSASYKIDRNSIRVNDFYIRFSNPQEPGFYTITDEDISNMKLVNLLIGGSGYTKFIIPDLLSYMNVVLTVYNRWGSLVYKNNSYQNDFDAENFKNGTYYYELSLEDNTGQISTIQNFLEIKRTK